MFQRHIPFIAILLATSLLVAADKKEGNPKIPSTTAPVDRHTESCDNMIEMLGAMGRLSALAGSSITGR